MDSLPGAVPTSGSTPTSSSPAPLRILLLKPMTAPAVLEGLPGQSITLPAFRDLAKHKTI